MLHLALELIVLVFATSLAGLAAGFAAGKLRNIFSGARTDDAMSMEEPSAKARADLDADATAARRIPDPAPPSEGRRKRLLQHPPS